MPDFIVELGERELGVNNLRTATGIGFPVGQLYLCPTHKLRLADAAQAVELLHGWEQLLACFLAKLCAEPSMQMFLQSEWRVESGECRVLGQATLHSTL